MDEAFDPDVFDPDVFEAGEETPISTAPGTVGGVSPLGVVGGGPSSLGTGSTLSTT